MFLSLSFASKEDLGWDMSIKSTLDATKNKRLYDIEVGGELMTNRNVMCLNLKLGIVARNIFYQLYVVNLVEMKIGVSLLKV